jgi:hypothetical protein
MFPEENQQVAMKRESQLLFGTHLLFAGFSRFFHDYRDSIPEGLDVTLRPKGYPQMLLTATRILANGLAK